MVYDVSRVLVPTFLVVQAGNGIADTVAQVHSSVPETDTGKSGGQKHCGLCFRIFTVSGDAREILDGLAESPL